MAISSFDSASAAPPAVTYLYPAGAQRGATVEVTAAGSFERWPVEVWVSDPAITVKAAKDKGKLSIIIAKEATPGVHWLRFHDSQGASTLRPFIVGTLPDVQEKEPNDDVAKAQMIETSSVVNGGLQKAADVDVFAMNLKKGQTLVASLDAYRSLRSPMDGVMQILSADGFVVEQNNDWSSLDPQIVFSVPKDGTYLIRLFAFPATPNASIRLSGAETYVYRLTLTTGGFIDYTMPLAVRKGQQGTVSVEGWNIPNEAKSISPIVEDDVATVFHPLLANTFKVKVEDHPTGSSEQPSVPPFSVTHVLKKPGETAAHQVKCKKGQALNIRVESREFGLEVNPVIRVLNTSSKQLARAEPAALNRDTELNFTPPADGIYEIQVRDLFDGGGPRHVYRLRVLPPEPSFELAVATDRFALAPGKPLDIPITITNRGGFTKEIAIAAEGLPAGMKAELVSPAKGNTKSATLRLTAEKAGPSGAFRIIGRSTDPKLERVAKAPLAEFDTTTPDLWLAVGGEAPPPPKKKKR